jgi:hypothetical protein
LQRILLKIEFFQKNPQGRIGSEDMHPLSPEKKYPQSKQFINNFF